MREISMGDTARVKSQDQADLGRQCKSSTPWLTERLEADSAHELSLIMLLRSHRLGVGQVSA
ncbi:hypothetical protein, partial [Enterococcus faecalis]|uniref:hypothetical protein n=1 Tax=Enterococcus faecalis TaxID=1351 RepID=UPI003D6AD62C